MSVIIEILVKLKDIAKILALHGRDELRLVPKLWDVTEDIPPNVAVELRLLLRRS
jgi:hypothetical protein